MMGEVMWWCVGWNLCFRMCGDAADGARLCTLDCIVREVVQGVALNNKHGLHT